MTGTAVKQQAIAYVEQLDNEKANLALFYLKNLAEGGARQTNSKTPQEREQAAKAFAELEKIRLHLNQQNSADNDRKTIANAIWKKYESLD